MAALTDTPLVFIDTETTGLNTFSDDIWEVAGIRRDTDGEHAFQMFVHHDPRKAEHLPERYFNDYQRRFDRSAAVSATEAVNRIIDVCAGRAVMVGANISFDMHLIERMLRDAGHTIMPWDYHLLDIEAYALGHLAGRIRGPWKSDELARQCGVQMGTVTDPEYRRHTAADDARWVRDWYDTINRPVGATYQAGRSTAIPEPRLVAIRQAAKEAAAQSQFVDPHQCFRASRVIRTRGERWAAAILGRDLSRRSMSDPSLPHLTAGELEVIVAADTEEDRHAVAHLDTP
ncbi:3'-5' exonuclease [Gordonia otitidis]|uniref:Exonuclease domain-containing protein n=1 Tax=Gordonia otitidis (strain DSM 44809 / CCUG 52243 / JCM 12355 / NBRC 100426 / IFM 10032) TaxID=1108044 RepID=H5TRT2_GORO1|nr:3'-5' exonuclease [Gordonia otitidis]GAB36190.1 hypothetical protein GOOTI_202_00460 [Gordonia otitidis NBRC 100426]